MSGSNGRPYRCELATQAVMAGNQDIRVLAANGRDNGLGHGHIAVRVGRLLVYVHDREALEAFTDAWAKAADLADAAFGPILPPPAYRPRRLSNR